MIDEINQAVTDEIADSPDIGSEMTAVQDTQDILGEGLPVEETFEEPSKQSDVAENDPMLADADPEKGNEPTYKGEEAFWYVVHTYSGYENKVKNTLEMIVENRGIHDYIQEVYVPTEEVVEIKDGKKKISQRKIYPGYVMIKMVLTDEIWYIVRNTRGVTGFVGPNSKPVPLTEEELAIMGMETDWVPVVDYEVGDTIKIINGPLEGFMGTVEKLDNEKKKVHVTVSMFGRETPIELEFVQVVRA